MKGEDSLQIAVVDYLKYQYPNVLAFHVPNGGSRNAIEGAKLKRMGVMPGVSDILIFKCKTQLHDNVLLTNHFGLAIELKYGNNKQTKSQIEFADKIDKAGWHYVVCYTFDDAKKEIDNYLTMETYL